MGAGQWPIWDYRRCVKDNLPIKQGWNHRERVKPAQMAWVKGFSRVAISVGPEHTMAFCGHLMRRNYGYLRLPHWRTDKRLQSECLDTLWQSNMAMENILRMEVSSWENHWFLWSMASSKPCLMTPEGIWSAKSPNLHLFDILLSLLLRNIIII